MLYDSLNLNLKKDMNLIIKNKIIKVIRIYIIVFYNYFFN